SVPDRRGAAGGRGGGVEELFPGHGTDRAEALAGRARAKGRRASHRRRVGPGWQRAGRHAGAEPSELAGAGAVEPESGASARRPRRLFLATTLALAGAAAAVGWRLVSREEGGVARPVPSVIPPSLGAVADATAALAFGPPIRPPTPDATAEAGAEVEVDVDVDV